MTLAILLLGLIVATCFIAYLADNLGKNLGKKRVSLQIGRWSLRPRQTATLISMAASVGIMLLTVAILLLTSGSLSNALLRYDEEKRLANRARERAETLAKALQGEIQSKQNAIRASDEQLSQLQKSLRGTSTQLRSTQLQLASAQRARGTAERARQAAIRSASQAKQSATRAQRNLQTALARYESVRRQFTDLHSQLQGARNRFTEARRQLHEEQGRVAASRLKLDEVRNTLGSTRSQLQEAKTEFEGAQAAYEQAQSSLKTVNEEVKKQLADFKRVEEQKAELETRIGQLRTETDRLEAVAELYKNVAGRFAAGDITVSQGMVLAEDVVAPGKSSSQYHAELQAVLEEARRTLDDVKSTPRLFPLPFRVGNKVVRLEGEDILTHLSEYLTTFDVPITIRLTAVRNHVVGETEIDSQFWIVPVRTIYTEGETLIEGVIAADAGDARIFNQLLALLNDAEKAARARGAVPLPTKENPYFFSSGTNERIFDALRRIQALGSAAHVRLVAAKDLTTTESMRVRFEITRE